MKLSRIAWALVLLTGLVLSMKSLREPDLWWMLRTGEWIGANWSVPKTDVFSYTQEGASWLNVKWLFEWLLYVVSSVAGAEGVMLMQAGATLGILSLLRGRFRLLMERLTGAGVTQRQELIFALWAFVGLLLLDFRIIGRPEMVSHLFAAAYLYIFAHWEKHKNPRTLYALPALQALWANLHEGFGVGMVFLGIWAVGEGLQWLRNRKKTGEKAPMLQILVALGAILAVCLHPWGFSMLMHPINIYGQLRENQFTTELLGFSHPEYWQWEAYGNVACIGIALLSLAVWWRKGASIMGAGTWLIGGAVLYLSFTAYRNIPFAVLWYLPAVAAGAVLLFEAKVGKWASDKVLMLKVGVVGLLLYAAIVSNTWYSMVREGRDSYGLQVLNSHNPVGAAQFVRENGLQKQRAYADYLTSSYLLWALQPDFKTYIDLRDLDVFADSFFQTFAATTIIPDAFNKEDSAYNFGYAVVFRPQFPNLHQHLLRSDNYDLVFADAVAVVYAKNSSENAELIRQKGFKANNKKDIFSPIKPSETSHSLAYGITKLFNPFFANKTLSAIWQDLLAGEFYQGLGEYELATARAAAAMKHKSPENWRAHELMGNIYNAQIAMQTDPAAQQSIAAAAEGEYQKAIKQNPRAVNSLLGKGLVAYQMQRYGEAVKLFQEVLRLDSGNFGAIRYSAYAYKIRYFNQGGAREHLDQWLYFTQKMDAQNPNNPFIMLDLGLAYCHLNDCERSRQYLTKITDFPQFSPDEQTAMRNCLQKCK